jgi:hypothetical protein
VAIQPWHDPREFRRRGPSSERLGRDPDASLVILDPRSKIGDQALHEFLSVSVEVADVAPPGKLPDGGNPKGSAGRSLRGIVEGEELFDFGPQFRVRRAEKVQLPPAGPAGQVAGVEKDPGEKLVPFRWIKDRSPRSTA